MNDDQLNELKAKAWDVQKQIETLTVMYKQLDEKIMQIYAERKRAEMNGLNEALEDNG